ncbi:DUF2778 domain-containing protein [Mesorhizobium sp. KR1-2]|uniref:DUF2778 domain-containing protein n=1 Tax=Mesorhizobium sp. KR1-2 TaxID=3156609 RepID=UPI0032B39386
MLAVSSPLTLGSGQFLPKPQFYPLKKMQAQLSNGQARTDEAPRLTAATEPFVTASIPVDRGKSARLPHVAAADGASDNSARFDAVVKQAGLTPEKLASLFDRSKSAKQGRRLAAKVVAPAPERFASLPAISGNQTQTMLAYADSAPGGAAGAALSALLTAPLDEDLAASQDPDLDLGDEAAGLPVYEDTPPDGPLPQLRPLRDSALMSGAVKPGGQQTEDQAAPKANEPRKADEGETRKPQQLAYARPDYPADRSTGGGLGQRLRNLFGGGTKPGNGVAVYDISAAKVYMPDGSVLEAHSGVGKMADDPKYVHVKMNGPTPPHTYNLKMRESRFHGVEAIRMLPADGKNKYGRDGFLTHSYLLRGRQAQSHGCVAFKDYDRFLTAFKQGKVKQIIVVPNGGQEAIRVASNGKSA